MAATFDFSHLPFDPFTPFPELTSPTTPTKTTTPTTTIALWGESLELSSRPTANLRRTWKPYGRTHVPNTATQPPTTSSPSSAKNPPNYPPALINHTFVILDETQEQAYTSPNELLPAKRKQLPGRSDVISNTSARSSAHYLTSYEPTLTTPKTRKITEISSALYDIVIDSVGRDGNSVRNSQMDDFREEKASKSSKIKSLSIDKSDKENTKGKGVKKLFFPKKEKFAERNGLENRESS